MSNTFNPKEVAESLRSLGYHCEVKDGAVVVQDPVYVTGGTAKSRFVEFKAVTLRSDAEARRFISDRS